MQWGQIKTLFILCFLILDIFLIQQFMTTREAEPSFTEEQSNEDALKADIEGLEDLSEEALQESYLYATRKQITDEDKTILESFENQEIVILSGDMIISKFEEPLPVSDENGYSETLQPHVLDGNKYQYWATDEPSNTLIFFQKNEGLPIYYNQSGLLLVSLNEEGEVIQYIQTMLENEVDDQQNDYDLITDLAAVSHLYNNTTELNHGDEVKVDLGFHNLTHSPTGAQVLAPTWKVTVNEDRNYFIHAIESYAYPRDDSSFLRDTIGVILDNLPEAEDNEFINETRIRLTQILNQQDGVE